eukprot:TRINITY_DN8447_c0_g1_i2.p1 TRINITY_DN8447_c0_g1~~TRINITY_DN8447_c0_g1_i2.p1  ORF type:complete len:185 (-),score=21.70 TRINITY_DN8447_c0_g1_i2:340-894(-)
MEPNKSMNGFSEPTQITGDNVLYTVDESITNEYLQIVKTKIETNIMEEATTVINAPKNRYCDVLPIKETAVRLHPIPGVPGSDYINANIIRDRLSGGDASGKKKSGRSKFNKQHYIACQAPLQRTSADFWRMIWQYNVPVIVMITNLFEKNRPKADAYWPEKVGGTNIYGETCVKLVCVQQLIK